MSCATVFRDMHFFDYLTSLLESDANYQVTIVTYLITYPEPGSVLDKFFSLLNSRPSRIIVGTSRWVKESSVQREIKRITKRWPRIVITLTYNDHRKIYLLSRPKYNGACYEGTVHRCWLSTLNLSSSFSKNTTVELSAEQTNFVRQML